MIKVCLRYFANAYNIHIGRSCKGAQETSTKFVDLLFINTVSTGDIPLKKAKRELYEHTVKSQGEATEDVKTTGMVN